MIISKNKIVILFLLVSFYSCKNETKKTMMDSTSYHKVGEQKNLDLRKEDTKSTNIALLNKKVVSFGHMTGMLTSEPTLTGEFMSKLNLNNFKIFTVKVTNKNGIEDDEKVKIVEILGYDNLKGFYANEPNYNKKSSNEPDIIESKNRFEFTDSSGFCIEKIEFYDNIFDKHPECSYQILSIRKFIYEVEKENIPFQFVYPDRLLKLCK